MLRRCALVASNISHVISSEQAESIIYSYSKLCDLFKIINRISQTKTKETTAENKASTTNNDTKIAKETTSNTNDIKISNDENNNDDDPKPTKDTTTSNNSNNNNNNIDEDEPLLAYYPFISLPKNFLEFSAEPYSYDILNISCNDSHQYLCLLTGECFETDDVLDHLKEVGYTIFLVLTGLYGWSCLCDA